MSSDEPLTVRRDAAVWREIDGETIVLDLASAHYLGLNATATRLWAAVVAGAGRRDLVVLLTETFDVDTGQAERDVDAFLESCRARGLIE